MRQQRCLIFELKIPIPPQKDKEKKRNNWLTKDESEHEY